MPQKPQAPSHGAVVTAPRSHCHESCRGVSAEFPVTLLKEVRDQAFFPSCRGGSDSSRFLILSLQLLDTDIKALRTLLQPFANIHVKTQFLPPWYSKIMGPFLIGGAVVGSDLAMTSMGRDSYQSHGVSQAVQAWVSSRGSSCSGRESFPSLALCLWEISSVHTPDIYRVMAQSEGPALPENVHVDEAAGFGTSSPQNCELSKPLFLTNYPALEILL